MESTARRFFRPVHWLLLASMLVLHCSQADEYGSGGCAGNRYQCTERVTNRIKATRYTQTAYREHYRYDCGLFNWFRCTGRRTRYRRSVQYYLKTTYSYRCRTCNIDCRVSQWSSWACSSPCCLVLRESRARTVSVARYGSGRSCPSLTETRTRYDDNKACYIAGTCYRHLQKSSNGCNQCNKQHSRSSWKTLSGSTYTCNDGNACTSNDRCWSGTCRGTSYSCLTGCQACVGNGQCRVTRGCVTSNSSCGCGIGGSCYSDVEVNPSNQCQMCNFSRDAFHWSNVSYEMACDDNDNCTVDDKCIQGVCRGVDLPCMTCDTCEGHRCLKLRQGMCFINGECYSRYDRNPMSQCQGCDPEISENATDIFSILNGSSCDDGNNCSKEDRCDSSGTCIGTSYQCLPGCQACDGLGGCTLTKGCLISSEECGCYIEEECYGDTSPNPSDDCQICDVTRDVNGWTYAGDDTQCNDTDPCTHTDTCRNGTCRGYQFSCDVDDEQTCVQSSTCNGENCTIVYRPSTYRCYISRHDCDWQDQFCSGESAFCPRIPPKPMQGSVLVLSVDDQTPLISTLLADGNRYLIITQRDTLNITFTNFSVSCGEVEFRWWITMEHNDGSQTPVTDIFNATSDRDGTVDVSRNNLNLENGGVYRVAVNATSSHFRSVVKVESQMILVDVTPPRFNGTIVLSNFSSNASYMQSSTSSLFAQWDINSFQDPESGVDITTFTVAVGSRPGLTDVSEPVPAESDRGELTGLNLDSSKTYYATVSVSNHAGLVTSVVSSGVLVDNTPPTAGVVVLVMTGGYENSGTCLSQCTRRMVAAIVNFDDEESGIATFQWKLCGRHKLFNIVRCSEQGFTDFECFPWAGIECHLDVQHPNDWMVYNGCLRDAVYDYDLHIRVWNGVGYFTDKVSQKTILRGAEESLNVFDLETSDHD